MVIRKGRFVSSWYEVNRNQFVNLDTGTLVDFESEDVEFDTDSKRADVLSYKLYIRPPAGTERVIELTDEEADRLRKALIERQIAKAGTRKRQWPTRIRIVPNDDN